MGNDSAEVRDARYRLLGLQVIPHAEGIILRRGKTHAVLYGDGVAELVETFLARAAEGSEIRIAELVAAVPEARRARLPELIETLAAHGFLVAAEAEASGAERKEDIFFWNHGTERAVAADALAGVALTIFGVNHIGLALLGNLRSIGFRTLTLVDHPDLRNLDFYDDAGELRAEIRAVLSTPPKPFEGFPQEPGDRPACHIVCSDFGGLALMREWNREAVEHGVHFYPVVLQDELAYLGPLVVPHAGPCFECFWIRRASHLEDRDAALALEMQAREGQQLGGYLQPMARVAADIAAIDLVKYWTALPGGEAGRLIEADLMQPSLTARTVLKVPRCPVCSQLADMPSSAPPVETQAAEPEIVAESL